MDKKMEIKKSQLGLKELIATLVVSGILLVIGVIVFAKVYSATNSMMNDTDYNYTTASETANSVSSTVYDSFELSTVALVVLAAAVIIGILIRAFGA